MPNDDRTYSAEFKTEVAKKAIEQDKKNLGPLSEKYEVPVSSILTWAVQLEKNAGEFFEETEEPETAEDYLSGQEEISVEVANREVAGSIQHGVMFDTLNIRRLIFWSIAGIVLLSVFVQALVEMHQYNRQIAREAAPGMEYYQVNRQKREAVETLNSFGVVDLENGIYRIPIDSAINEMAENQ